MVTLELISEVEKCRWLAKGMTKPAEQGFLLKAAGAFEDIARDRGAIAGRLKQGR